MKNKSFLSKLEELKPQVPLHLEVERKLVPRLKFMGYVMFVFCISAFIFALTIQKNPLVFSETMPIHSSNSEELIATSSLLTDDSELELSATEILNFYIVSLVFAFMGSACFLIVWKKRKVLFHESTSKKE